MPGDVAGGPVKKDETASLRFRLRQLEVFAAEVSDHQGVEDWTQLLTVALGVEVKNLDWVSDRVLFEFITLEGAQTSIAGGGNTIAYASGSGDAADLYNTAGSADTVTATGSAVFLNSAQATVTGGGDWVDFQSGSGNAVTLAGTNNSWDWVTATGATVDFDGAQAFGWSHEHAVVVVPDVGARVSQLLAKREHVRFAWMPVGEAIQRVPFVGLKQALSRATVACKARKAAQSGPGA